MLALFLGAVGIAFAPILVRLSPLDPVLTALYRTALAVPVLFIVPMMIVPGPERPTAIRDSRQIGMLLLAGVFFAGDLGLWHYSIGLTSVANATLLPNLAPVFVTFAAWVLFRERITRRFLIGLLMALVGAVILLGDSAGKGERHLSGDLLGIVVAMFYAAYLLTVSRLRKQFSALQVMAWSTLGTALALLPFAFWHADVLLPPTLGGWAVLLALAWFTHIGGQGLIAWALAHLPVSFGSVGLMLQPALASLFAWIIFGEALGPWQFAGAIVILCGIYLARRGVQKK